MLNEDILKQEIYNLKYRNNKLAERTDELEKENKELKAEVAKYESIKKRVRNFMDMGV